MLLLSDLRTHKTSISLTRVNNNSMFGFKLTIAASIYASLCKWVRTITTTSRTRTIAPPVHVSLPHSHKNLGFRVLHPRFPLLRASSSSSSGDKGGFPVSGSCLVADMDSDNKPSPPIQQLQHQQKQSSSKFLTLPTILTLGRVAAVPVLVTTFYVDSWWGRTATINIFIAAAITDWLDGYLARKMRLGTTFGAFLDPVADKLMVATTLVLLCTRPLEVAMFGQLSWLLAVPSIAIIGREITMSAVREWAASQNAKLLEAVAVNNLGKWKTATQMAALTILLATRESSLGGTGILAASGVILLYISAGLSVWSLAVYMGKISKVLLK